MSEETPIEMLTPVQKIKQASAFVAIMEDPGLKELMLQFPSGDVAFKLFHESMEKEVAKLTGDTIQLDVVTSCIELSQVVENMRQLQNMLIDFVRSTTAAAKAPVAQQRPVRQGRLQPIDESLLPEQNTSSNPFSQVEIGY